ncbi:MAG: thiamine pyrophosphate-binding protein [Bacteriovoracaceae bacterium]
MKVRDFIAEYLEKKSLNHVYGVSGANIEDLFFAIGKRNHLTPVLAKTEYQAAMMAIGSYLSTRKVHAVITTSGPGVLNTLPVLAEAYSAHLPLVLISGSIPTKLEGHGGFQDGSGLNGSLPLKEIIRPTTQFFKQVNLAREIREALDQAFESAERYKRPSAIFIPKNIFDEEINPDSLVLEKLAPPMKIDEKIVNQIDQYISQNSPIIVLTEGLFHLDSPAHLIKILERLKAKVLVTPGAKGFFPANHPNFVGMLGIMGDDKVNEELEKHESILIIGGGLDQLSQFGHQDIFLKKNILEIAWHWSNTYALSKNHLILRLDLNQWIDKCFHHSEHQAFTSLQPSAEIHDHQFSMINIIQTIQNHLEVDTDIFIDAGNSGAFAINRLALSGKSLCYISLAMGGMGNSLGAAIGACFTTQRRAFVLMGDGSFLMYGLEIHTAIQHQLPLTVIIFNNNSHAMCATREEVFLGEESTLNKFSASYFGHGLSQMFPSLTSEDIDTLDHLEKSLKKNKTQKGPAVLSLNIDPSEFPPFKSFKSKRGGPLNVTG